MSNLLIGLVGALVATNQPAAVSNLVLQTTGITVPVVDPNDPVEKELHKLMEDDDAAQTEVDKWITDNQAFAAAGGGVSAAELNARIRKRLESVCKGYEDLIKRHPKHTRALIAYASFLGDIHDEDTQQDILEKALTIETNDPAIYNNLANIYGHHGSVTNAFAFYAKAIQLNQREPVYYENFGTTVYLFRKDAREYYSITENQVFAKAFDLYSNAMRLEPDNFPFASNVAQSYYGVRPFRTDEALNAWTNALKIAHDDVEREGVYIHFARCKVLAGRFDQARLDLAAVTNSMYSELKRRISKTLAEKEAESKTNNLAVRAAATPEDRKATPGNSPPSPTTAAAETGKAEPGLTSPSTPPEPPSGNPALPDQTVQPLTNRF